MCEWEWEWEWECEFTNNLCCPGADALTDEQTPSFPGQQRGHARQQQADERGRCAPRLRNVQSLAERDAGAAVMASPASAAASSVSTVEVIGSFVRWMACQKGMAPACLRNRLLAVLSLLP